MSDQSRILIVDDSAAEIRILMTLLKDEYQLFVAKSGPEALAQARQHNPDLILLDVNMEPMDGYETCEQLKNITPNTPVIFVSSNDTTEEILKGFEAGGTDYITKPITPEILKQKVRVVLQRDDDILEVVDTLNPNDASCAFICFYRSAIQSAEKSELKDAIVKLLDAHHIEYCFLITDNDDVLSYSSKNDVTQMEYDLLRRAKELNSDCIVKGKRLILVHGAFSLLVKNLPEHDESKAELVNTLKGIAPDIDALCNMHAKPDVNNGNLDKAIAHALAETRQTLTLMDYMQGQHKQKSVAVMDELIDEVESHFVTLGLTEQQEDLIHETLKRKVGEALEIVEEGYKLDDTLTTILQSLEQVAPKQEEQEEFDPFDF